MFNYVNVGGLDTETKQNLMDVLVSRNALLSSKISSSEKKCDSEFDRKKAAFAEIDLADNTIAGLMKAVHTLTKSQSHIRNLVEKLK